MAMETRELRGIRIAASTGHSCAQAPPFAVTRGCASQSGDVAELAKLPHERLQITGLRLPLEVESATRRMRYCPDRSSFTDKKLFDQPHAANAGNALQRAIQMRRSSMHRSLRLSRRNLCWQPGKIVLLERSASHRRRRQSALQIIKLVEAVLPDQLVHILATTTAETLNHRPGGEGRTAMIAVRHERNHRAASVN